MTVDLIHAAGDAAAIHSEKMGAVARVVKGMTHEVADMVDDAASTIHQALAEGGSADHLAAAARALSRVAMIARQLESIGQPGPGRAVARPLGTAVREILAMVRRLAGDGVLVDVRELDESVWAAAAVGQIEQVVFHLVVNGRDAMPGGGRLGIGVRRETIATAVPHRHGVLMAGEWAVLEVRDNGIGMDDSMLGQLFEPFFTTKAPGLGSGLGLATVYGIARGLGGQMLVESRLGEGSSFECWLPAVAIPASVAGPAESESKIAVLVVDDDEWVRAVTVRALKRAGYGTLEADSAGQALTVLNDIAGGCIRAVLTEAALPGGSGTELANQIRSTHPEVRVILMTGRGPELANALAASGEAVLQKPFSRAELYRALQGD